MTASRHAGLMVGIVVLVLMIGGTVAVYLAIRGTPSLPDAHAPGGSTSLPSTATVNDDHWRERFNQVYSLRDDEVLKRIAPPFIPERDVYYAVKQPDLGTDAPNAPDVFYFTWDTGIQSNPGYSWGSTTTAGALFSKRMQLEPWQFEGPDEFFQLPLSGDWIIRVGATEAQKLEAMMHIIQSLTGRLFRVDLTQAQREVVVVRGQLHLPADGVIRLVEPQLPGRLNSGNMTTDFTGLMLFLGRACDMQMIDLTLTDPQTPLRLAVEGRWGRARNLPSDIDRQAIIERRLAALPALTGLTFSRERRMVDVWRVSESPKSP